MLDANGIDQVLLIATQEEEQANVAPVSDTCCDGFLTPLQNQRVSPLLDDKELEEQLNSTPVPRLSLLDAGLAGLVELATTPVGTPMSEIPTPGSSLD